MSKKVTAPPEVYQLHVWLREISPMIWRRFLVRSVECPPIYSTDLDDLTCKLFEQADLRCVKGRATP
jgi:hypothetical protein